MKGYSKFPKAPNRKLNISFSGNGFNIISSSSSSSCRATSTDFPDPLSPLFPIIHRLWLQSYIPYPHIAAQCLFVQVVLLLNWPYVGVHRRTLLMRSSLVLQQCPACLVDLTWIAFVMEGRWPYSWCLVGCYC